MFDPCATCGASWFRPHRADCAAASVLFVQALERDGRVTADGTPRCPHCGYGHDDWTEAVSGRRGPIGDGDGDVLGFTCPGCDRDYEAELVVNYSFRYTRRT